MSVSTILKPNATESYKHVSCTAFQLTTNPVNGYVLTSDADGNAGWTEAGGFAVETISSANSAISVNSTDPQNVIIGFTGNCAGLTITTDQTATFSNGIIFGGGSGTLNYYDLSNSLSLGAPTGASTTGSLSIYYRRIGNMTQLTLPTFTPAGAGTSGASTMGFTTALPVALRPVTGLTLPVVVVDNAVSTYGVCNIGTSGAVTFGVGATSGAYTGSTNATGFTGFCTSYAV